MRHMKYLTAILIPILALSATAKDKPNFIFILSDDIAQGDLGCYGQELIQTPNLDTLASEGTCFSKRSNRPSSPAFPDQASRHF